MQLLRMVFAFDRVRKAPNHLHVWLNYSPSTFVPARPMLFRRIWSEMELDATVSALELLEDKMYRMQCIQCTWNSQAGMRFSKKQSIFIIIQWRRVFQCNSPFYSIPQGWRVLHLWCVWYPLHAMSSGVGYLYVSLANGHIAPGSDLSMHYHPV